MGLADSPAAVDAAAMEVPEVPAVVRRAAGRLSFLLLLVDWPLAAADDGEAKGVAEATLLRRPPLGLPPMRPADAAADLLDRLLLLLPLPLMLP